MVNKCSAINCRSGYKGENKDPNVTFHSFPLDNKQLLQVWLQRIARKDFHPTNNSRLCSLHFKQEDFILHSTDQNTRRKRKRADALLSKKRLRNDAAPSIFKDLPDYYTSNDIPSRSGLSLSSSRLQQQSATLDAQCESFLQNDKVTDFEEFVSKISRDAQDLGFLLHKTDEECNFILLSTNHPLSIHATVTVDKTLAVKVYHKQQLVPASAYIHIMASNQVKLFSQIANLLAFAKNLDLNKPAMEDTFKLGFLRLVKDQLEITENDQQASILRFISEQVDLMYKINSKQRRYSMELLMMAYIIYATSPRAYQRLIEEGVLILPSIKTLKRITMKLDRTTGLDDVKYLKMRFGQLNAFDRNIVLMIDEIYLSKRVEATRGEIFGLTENCEVASTALCFMVKSLSSDYQDMVGIFPVKNLKANVQKQCFDKIMGMLHEVGFNVIAISVDNAAANRKFYKDFLCGGDLQECIDNNFTGGKLFLLFDPTHVIKNVYNNFLSRKIFKMPSMLPLVPDTIIARFCDVEAVYANECHKPLKLAHKLTDTVLKPNSIEKVNVKLAMSLLHESTINALRAYGFTETAKALQLFAKLWSILNVGTPNIGKHKRDITRDPIRSADDWKLQFLLDFENYAGFWKNSMLPGLTKETFLALSQTCRAMVGLSKYLLNSCQFNYVLLGKIQSDTIEGRFGHFRQLSGANYFISMRQLYESDRKLRALSLVKYSKVSLKDIDNAAKAVTSDRAAQEVMAKADSIAADLQLTICPDANDASVIFYVSGYCCRSLVKVNKCESCKDTTVADVESENHPLSGIPANALDFFQNINRGGLWKPNLETFKIGTLCWRVFAEISQHDELRKQFLTCVNQRNVFKEIINITFYENWADETCSITTMCAKGHNILEGMASRFFNCMAKNFMRDLREDDGNKSSRKIRKLTGC